MSHYVPHSPTSQTVKKKKCIRTHIFFCPYTYICIFSILLEIFYISLYVRALKNTHMEMTANYIECSRTLVSSFNVS